MLPSGLARPMSKGDKPLSLPAAWSSKARLHSNRKRSHQSRPLLGSMCRNGSIDACDTMGTTTSESERVSRCGSASAACVAAAIAYSLEKTLLIAAVAAAVEASPPLLPPCSARNRMEA